MAREDDLDYLNDPSLHACYGDRTYSPRPDRPVYYGETESSFTSLEMKKIRLELEELKRLRALVRLLRTRPFDAWMQSFRFSSDD